MPSRAGRRPLGLIALILAITVVPLAILLWLGFTVLTQERLLTEQQADRQAKTAADAVVAALQEAVATSEKQVAAGWTEWPAGAAMVTIRSDGLTVVPSRVLAFLPIVDPLPEAPEFTTNPVGNAQDHDQELKEALETRDSDPNRLIRVTAIFKLAGIEWRSKHLATALRKYEQVLSVDDVAVEGQPVSLLARWARCQILASTGDQAALKPEAQQLLNDLQQARWMITESAYRLYTSDANKWLERTPGRLTDREVLAEAVSRVWASQMSSLNPRASEAIGDRIVTVLKVKTERYPRALVATDEFVKAQWVLPVQSIDAALPLVLAVGVAARPGARSDVRTADQTRLPWDISLTRKPEPHVSWSRRMALPMGLAVVVVMALIAAYAIVRAVNREMAVARLQSDFVAAVSHEFRTPLTSLRQFTGMLSDGTAADEEARKVCYDAQGRATDRLTKLVESVLDFGRMEAGAKPYHFEVHDCAEIVGGVVEDFRREPRAQGYRIDFARTDAPRIEVDREALARAVWNLIDNAIKYSPGRHLVEVAMGRRPDGVAITVRDYGIGVPLTEQQAIFDRFARGGEAQKRGIKGTGIGLSMVDHIVRAHRGRIELESEPGKGSSFTLILPTRV